MAEEFSKSRLTRWRRCLVLREVRVNDYGYRTSFCPLCNHDFSPWALQAHHIRPKSLYPEKAYDLDNGIALCLGCHMASVHGGSSFQDLRKEVHHWKFFVPSFDRYVDLVANRDFNARYQKRV